MNNNLNKWYLAAFVVIAMAITDVAVVAGLVEMSSALKVVVVTATLIAIAGGSIYSVAKLARLSRS
jgi:hypothetical protein